MRAQGVPDAGAAQNKQELYTDVAIAGPHADVEAGEVQDKRELYPDVEVAGPRTGMEVGKSHANVETAKGSEDKVAEELDAQRVDVVTDIRTVAPNGGGDHATCEDTSQH